MAALLITIFAVTTGVLITVAFLALAAANRNLQRLLAAAHRSAVESARQAGTAREALRAALSDPELPSQARTEIELAALRIEGHDL